MDKENNSVKINAEATANDTNIISVNITKVNCSSEKIYGPVEVLNA